MEEEGSVFFTNSLGNFAASSPGLSTEGHFQIIRQRTMKPHPGASGQRPHSSPSLFLSNGVFYSYLKPDLHGYGFLTDSYFDHLSELGYRPIGRQRLFM